MERKRPAKDKQKHKAKHQCDPPVGLVNKWNGLLGVRRHDANAPLLLLLLTPPLLSRLLILVVGVVGVRPRRIFAAGRHVCVGADQGISSDQRQGRVYRVRGGVKCSGGHRTQIQNILHCQAVAVAVVCKAARCVSSLLLNPSKLSRPQPSLCDVNF